VQTLGDVQDTAVAPDEPMIVAVGHATAFSTP
jgi:hypothetical protein